MARAKDLGLDFNPGRSESIKAWYRARVEQIHQRVSAYDVLSKHGVSLGRHGRQNEQISCPFHGKDEKPSATYHPDADDSRSHVWCYVCRENWDCIKLWQKFTGIDKFTEALFDIERYYGLSAPELDLPGLNMEAPDPRKEEIERVLSTCEVILRRDREQLGLDTVLKIGSMLDKVHHSYENKLGDLDTLKGFADKILAKIGERLRAPKAKDSSP